MDNIVNLEIDRGESFLYAVRWETSPILYMPITGITQAAPAVVTAVAHGVPDGWRVAIVSAKGMRQINAVNTPPKHKDYKVATVLSADSIALNDVNSADFSAYTSGGYVQYNTPKDMTGFAASLVVKDYEGGNVLLTLTPVIDNTAKTITISMSAAATAALAFDDAIYELLLTSSLGDVTELMAGSITVTD